ncbi:MAG: tyrosine-type recombinase/integrase [Hydrogenophaga sp.]|uniref:tyrosine-type recombinase/integrase n=1 Tax=Hydrogenophaga sp. TaxID=1904254 RepID=UPI002743514B|nr:tyrosine-type recombinase/integrase [Hydrogenophaga sp.]MDP2419349.1 tyrosine-type recombinase/integrase [Hydrogenophaga sp.]MDZ4187080.1 tyrosine-type recombinase/integrase [Hydrogenophaga sp.]
MIDSGGFVFFPARGGGRLSSDGVQYLLAKHVAVAGQACTSLRSKNVSPHVLRHTSAMDLLQAGVDTTVIDLAMRFDLSAKWEASN